MEPVLKESTISLANVYKSIITQIPPWIIKKPKVILQLSELPKTKTHPSTYIEKFHTILLHHPDHQYIFTDSTKDNNKTACAAVLNKTILKKGLPKESSIFTAEIYAIDLAQDIISKKKYCKYIIFSDSLSVLTSLKIKILENPLIIKLLNRLDSMSSHKEIIMCWIPSPIGVTGNERADSATKTGLDLSPDNTIIPYTDLKPQINRFFVTKRQQCLNDSINNKLFQSSHFGGMENSISKIKNGTSHYI